MAWSSVVFPEPVAPVRRIRAPGSIVALSGLEIRPGTLNSTSETAGRVFAGSQGSTESLWPRIPRDSRAAAMPSAFSSVSSTTDTRLLTPGLIPRKRLISRARATLCTITGNVDTASPTARTREEPTRRRGARVTSARGSHSATSTPVAMMTSAKGTAERAATPIPSSVTGPKSVM